MLSPPVPEGTILAGKYRVEQVLGRGGMGVVMSAWHLELDQRVALKFLGANLSESADAAERFRREARAAARIRSEHVVRVLDVGMVNETVPYMVMEFLEGHDLEQELERRGPLPVHEAVDYLLQAIEAIAEAHAAGIVHRDLKPGNLFLFRRPDGTNMIKVLDFGISKSIAAPGTSSNQMALTATASLIGSPLYMSPEQMQSPRAVDTRTDIWALGAILYHLLAGQPPYMGENIAQLCERLMNSTPEPLPSRRPDVPVGLDRVVARCLQKDREQRFANVSELAEALQVFASPFSQVHVSRAQRILTGSSGGARESTLASEGVSGTQSAWQRESTKRSPRPPRRWVLPVIAAVAGTAIAAFVWLPRGESESSTTGAPPQGSAAVLAPAVDGALSAVPASATRAPESDAQVVTPGEAVPPAPTEAAPAPSATGSVAPPAASSSPAVASPPAAPAPRSPAQPAAARPPVGTPRSTPMQALPKTPKTQENTARAGSPGVTDFGGRR